MSTNAYAIAAVRELLGQAERLDAEDRQSKHPGYHWRSIAAGYREALESLKYAAEMEDGYEYLEAGTELVEKLKTESSWCRVSTKPANQRRGELCSAAAGLITVLLADAKRLQHEQDLLRWALIRLDCGCLYRRDCAEHGECTEEYDFAKKILEEEHASTPRQAGD